MGARPRRGARPGRTHPSTQASLLVVARDLADTLGGALRKGHEACIVVFPRSVAGIPLEDKAHEGRANVGMGVVGLLITGITYGEIRG